MAQAMGGALPKGRAAPPGQAMGHQGAQIAPVQAQLAGAKGNIFVHGGADELVVRVLEKQADPLAHGIKGLWRERFAADPNTGLGGRVLGQQAIEVEQEGGFARAIRAEHGDALVLGDGKGELVERQPGSRVAVGEVANLDGSVHFQPRAHMAR